MKGEKGEYRKLFTKDSLMNFSLTLREFDDYFLLIIDGIMGKFETMVGKYPL